MAAAPPRLYLPIPMLILGLLQLLAGIVLFILDVISFAILRHWLLMAVATGGASGIWAGVFYIITGIFGIAAGASLKSGATPQDRRCPIITSIVLSVLSILSAISLTIAFAIMVNWDFLTYYPCTDMAKYLGSTIPQEECQLLYDRSYALLKAHLAFAIIMLIASVFQTVVAGMNLAKMPARTTTVTYVTRAPQPILVAQTGSGYHQSGVPTGAPVYVVQNSAPYPAGTISP